MDEKDGMTIFINTAPMQCNAMQWNRNDIYMIDIKHSSSGKLKEGMAERYKWCERIPVPAI